MKIKKIILPLSAMCLLIFASCGAEQTQNKDNQKKDSALPTVDTVTVKTVPEQPDTLKNFFGCYYAFEEKYSTPEEKKPESEWLNDLFQRIAKGHIGGNLFSHGGGGPNGAAWNPSNDLYLVIFTADTTAKASNSRLLLNGKANAKLKLNAYPSGNKTRTIFYCKVPQKTWEKQLREIKNSDLIPMFGKEKLKEIKENSPAPPNTGKIIEFTFVQSSQIKCTAFFHAEFGE